jgi:hypothetical protein
MINHSDPPEANTDFEYCVHPRFGACKAIVMLRDVPAGTELLVDYDFEIGPEWYRRRNE